MIKCLWLFFTLFLISVDVSANWKHEREALEHFYHFEKFRIFYTFEGRNALPFEKQQDSNGNSIPDYIEQLAINLQSAVALYCESFGLIHPLENSRYQNKAKYIDVHLLAMDNKGTASDAMVRYHYHILPEENDFVLSMKLSTHLRIASLTPQHELFHLYQNGYTMFKNRWYTEGTARWIEHAFKKGAGSRKPLPKTVAELDEILGQTYKTKYFWRQLAYLLDNHGGLFICPAFIKNQTGGCQSMIGDGHIYGYNFIKRFFEILDALDIYASTAYQLPSDNWSEAKQKSADNNIYLLCGLRYAIKDEYNSDKGINELDVFIKVLDEYTNFSCWKFDFISLSN